MIVFQGAFNPRVSLLFLWEQCIIIFFFCVFFCSERWHWTTWQYVFWRGRLECKCNKIILIFNNTFLKLYIIWLIFNIFKTVIHHIYRTVLIQHLTFFPGLFTTRKSGVKTSERYWSANANPCSDSTLGGGNPGQTV